VLSPAQVLERLGQRLDLLKGGRDADPRQQTLRSTIEWSHDLLSEQEQQLFARLGAFAGGCTLEAAECVVGAGFDTLESLVDKSLVRRTVDRFWMLETIRDFAVELLECSGEAEGIARAHAEYLLALAESANLSAESEGPGRPELVRRELDNFRQAIDWAFDRDLELAYRLAVGLEEFWVVHDAFEGARRLTALLDRAGGVSPVLRARALRVCSEATFIAGDYARARPLLDETLAISRTLADERAVAILLHRIGVGALSDGEISRARELFDESLAICRASPNPKLEGDILLNLGSIERAEGNRERALELFEEGAALCEEVGFTWMHAMALGEIADLSHELGRTDVAQERARESLRLNLELGDRRSTVFALALLARFAAEEGRATDAGRLWGAIEAEEARGPLGNWERHRPEYAAAILIDGGAELESARAAGQLLTLDEAAALALSVDSPS
jgi:tetratricopeptide (TPR) repeat protein